MSIRSDQGDERTLPSAYLDEGWLDHGYALTAHTAQGATVDRAFVLGSDELYREWGYTAMSRHRDQARFYVVSPGSVERALPGLERENDQLAEDVAATLTSSRSKDMALDVLRDSGAARTVRSLDAMRATMLEQRDAPRSALGAPPDRFADRDRWMRDTACLVDPERPPLRRAPSPPEVVHDLGMDL